MTDELGVTGRQTSFALRKLRADHVSSQSSIDRRSSSPADPGQRLRHSTDALRSTQASIHQRDDVASTVSLREVADFRQQNDIVVSRDENVAIPILVIRRHVEGCGLRENTEDVETQKHSMALDADGAVPKTAVHIADLGFESA